MRRLRVGIVDLVARTPNRRLWGRMMNANFASIMPQVIGCWCAADGHDVDFLCYTGHENLLDALPTRADIVFIGGFTQAAQLTYAISHYLRAKGAVTVLGGPHARCYPEDSQRYFDYVLGFVDRDTVRTVLADCAQHRPTGQRLSAARQPDQLPGVRERWPFIEPTLRKAPLVSMVPMIGSLGCPYTCSFCIDATVPYQPLDPGVIRDDLRFLATKMRTPRVGWHDPNFGVRFTQYLDAIEEAVPAGSVTSVAESSLSILSEPNVKRLARNGFKAVLPGIESWYDMGDKSKTGAKTGADKVRQVSDHVNMILEHIPYLQANFVLGLDSDEGDEPFTLTKQFLDRSPGAFPGFSLLTAFGQAAPLNLDYQRDGRVLPFPLHFLNNNHVMNVRPKHYSWTAFYDRLIDLQRHAFSWPSIRARYRAASHARPSWLRWVNVLRARSSEGMGRLHNFVRLRQLLDTPSDVRRYWDGETTEIPPFYVDWIKRDLGPFWPWLPEGALHHDPNAYLKSVEGRTQKLEVRSQKSEVDVASHLRRARSRRGGTNQRSVPEPSGGSSSTSIRQTAPFLNSNARRMPLRRAANSPIPGSWPTSAIRRRRDCFSRSLRNA